MTPILHDPILDGLANLVAKGQSAGAIAQTIHAL